MAEVIRKEDKTLCPKKKPRTSPEVFTCHMGVNHCCELGSYTGSR